MEFNRNQYFMFGLVLLFLGIQFRFIETFILNEKTSRFISEKIQPTISGADGSARSFLPAVGPTPRRTVRPPQWLGWALMSMGSVLILHSLAMKKPGG